MLKSASGGRSVFCVCLGALHSACITNNMQAAGCREGVEGWGGVRRVYGGRSLDQPLSEGCGAVVQSAGRVADTSCRITSTDDDWRVSPVSSDFSLSSPTSPALRIYPLWLPLPLSFSLLFRLNLSISTSSSSLLPPPPVPVLLARGGLWVNSRFFISLLWLGGDERIAIPLWEMSVSVCWESRGAFTSHQTRCRIDAGKWRVTGRSIEPNHLYQMWQQGKEDVW